MSLKEQVNLLIYKLAMKYEEIAGWGMSHPVSITELTYLIMLCVLNENDQDPVELEKQGKNKYDNLYDQIETYISDNHVIWIDRKERLVEVEFWTASSSPLKEESTEVYLTIFISCCMYKENQNMIQFCRKLLFYSNWKLLMNFCGNVSQEFLEKEEEILEEFNLNVDMKQVEQIINNEFNKYKNYCRKHKIRTLSYCRMSPIKELYIEGIKNWKEAQNEREGSKKKKEAGHNG